MSDLISRSELIEMIEGSEELLDFQKDECIACIDACDIAYDVDKVVERLEEKQKKAEYSWYDDFCFGKAHAYGIAIEIVKAGGDKT